MGGGGGTSPPIRNPAVEGSGWSTLRSGRSTFRKDSLPGLDGHGKSHLSQTAYMDA
jgi:hypothetical protein